MAGKTRGLRVTLPSQDMAALLRYAVVPTTRGKDDVPLTQAVHVAVGEDTFGGFDADWKALWSGVGVTAAATDRYRMHVAGALLEGEHTPGEALLSGPDVRVALANVPRGANQRNLPATLSWDGVGDAVLSWPRSQFTIAVIDSTYPVFRRIVSDAGSAEASDGGAFTGAYLSDAVLETGKFARHVRVRMSGLRPALVGAPVADGHPVRVGAVVMPVREAAY